MQEVCSFLHKSVSTVVCLTNKVILLTLTGYFKKRIVTNCVEILYFVNFKKKNKNGGYLCLSARPGCHAEIFHKPSDG